MYNPQNPGFTPPPSPMNTGLLPGPFPAPTPPPPPMPFGPPAPIAASGVTQTPDTGLLGRVLNIIQAVASAPSNALWTLPGNALHSVGMAPQGGREGFFDFLQKTINDPTYGSASSQMLGPFGGLMHSMGQLSPGLQRVGLEGLADPLNLVGAGVPQGALAARALEAAGVARSAAEARAAVAAGRSMPTLAEAALKAGLTPSEMQAQLVSRLPSTFGNQVWRGAAAADQAVQDATGAVMKAPFTAAGAALRRTPLPGVQVPEMVNDVMQMRPATSVMDFLTSKTRRTYYKGRLADLENAVQIILNNGHDLGTDVLDFASPPTAQFNDWKDAYKQTTNLYNDLTQSIRDIKDPYTKMAGLEAVRQAEERMYQVWEGVSVARQKAIDAGGSAADVALATNTALTDSWAQMYHTLGAARDTLRGIESHAAERAPLDPAVAQTISRSVDGAMRQVWGLRRGLRQMGTSLPRDTIVRLGEVQGRQLSGVRFRADQANQAIDAAFNAVGEQMPQLGDDVAGQFQRRYDSLMALQNGLRHGLSTELPSKFVGPLREDFADFMKNYSSIVRDRSTMENAVGELWDRSMPPNVPMPSLTGSNPGEWWTNINNALKTIQSTTGQQILPGGRDIADSVALREAIAPRISANTASKVDSVIQRWGKADILTDEPYRAAFDRVARQLQPKFGIMPPKPGSPAAIGNWWNNNIMQPWKATQLMTPAYLISNALGITANSALEGVSPVQIFKNLMTTIGPRARGEAGQFGTHAVYTPEAMDLYKELGIVAPVQTQNGSALLADLTPTGRFTGTGQSAIDRWGPLWLALGGGVGGATAGALTPGDPNNRAQNVAIGAGMGAGLGAAMPFLSRLVLQRLSAALEGAARETAWSHGVNQYLGENGALQLNNIAEQALRGTREGLQIDSTGKWIPKNTLDEVQMGSNSLPDLLFRGNPAPPDVQTAVDAAFPRVNTPPFRNPPLPIPNPALTVTPPTARVVQHGLTPDEVDQALQAISSRRGRMSQAELERALRTAGVNPEDARKAGMAWGEHLQKASDQGLNLANQINFNYEDLNNAEQAVKNISPFATWGLKAYPFFAKNLAAHPVLAESILNMLDESRKEQQSRGLTGRFDGTMEFNGVSNLLSKVLGRESHAYFNPLNALVPFSDVGSLQNMDPNDGLLSNLMDASNAFGFGMRPEMQFALRAGGAQGDVPASGYVRSASFLKALTSILGVNSGRGIDLNSPFIAAERGIRGRDNTPNLDESAITKRIDELALANTGIPSSSTDARVGPYVAAKVTRSGSIWDQAARDVAGDQAARAVPGFLLGQAATPRALLSGEEAKIRAARQEGLSLTPDQSKQLSDLAQNNPNAPVPPVIVSQVTAAATALAQENGHDTLPDEVTTLLQTPTAANVAQVQKWVYELEAQKSPLIQAYSGGGTERVARLNNAISLYNNPAGLLSMDPQQVGLSSQQTQDLIRLLQAARVMSRAGRPNTGGTTPMALALRENKGMRDALSNMLPDLGAYLAWRTAGGQGNAEDFIQSQGNQ
jgi:hypothetical protein